MQSRLTEEDIRHVLQRAEQLQAHATGSGLGAEAEELIVAAEESGLSREAMERALRERLQIPLEIPGPGQRVFARSRDGCFYVADVLESSGQGIRVKFSRGGEHVVTMSDVRECSLLPGDAIVAFWKDWGWAPGTIVSYDAVKGKVTVKGWAMIETLRITDIRLEPPKPPMSERKAMLVSHAIAFVSGAVASGLAWWLFFR